MNSWKSIFADNHAKIITILATVLVAGIVGAVVLANSQHQFLSKTPAPTPAKQSNNPSVAKAADTNVTPETQKPAETNGQTVPAPTSSSSAPSPSVPHPYIPPSNTPGPYPYRVTYVSLDQPTSYCAGSGQEAIILYDARLAFSNSDGGEVKYGFEVTGAANPWGSYQQPLPVPAGKTSYTINELRGMSPSTIFNMTVPIPHDAISVRVVIYSPNSTVSSWFTVPARGYGYCP